MVTQKREKTREIRAFIVNNIDDHPQDIVNFTVERFKMSRQAIARHVATLVEEGILEAEGKTRSRKYSLRTVFQIGIDIPIVEGVEEDRIWRERVREHLIDLPKNVYDVINHGFAEILNNAIDHSGGQLISVLIERTEIKTRIFIIDDGVGIFNKIQRECNLEDHRHAILELSKGKLTTDPARHTGLGIFFTSRMFDGFSIRSSKLYFSHSRLLGGWLLEDYDEHTQGTIVRMVISHNSTVTPESVFNKYTSGDDFSFSRTHVPVELVRYGEEKLISRSQAKRLLARFEKFKEVLLDFNGVDEIGPAFADEIFRVFRLQNPNIKIIHIDANEQVERMISPALSKEE